ncbi:MAG: DUF3267 domain-containing protein [Erysipelotrichaceae bacterium]
MTKKEARIQQFEIAKAEMLAQGYQASDGVISVVKANVMALVTAGPIALVCFLLYLSVWKGVTFTFDLTTLLVWYVLFTVGIVVHELLHGIGWSLFTPRRFHNIHFGILWSMLTPYCHCDVPLNRNQYLVGGLFPLFVLGGGLFLVAMVSGSFFWLSLALLHIIAAGGDTTIALMLRKYPDAKLLDHPTQCGFVAFQK